LNRDQRWISTSPFGYRNVNGTGNGTGTGGMITWACAD